MTSPRIGTKRTKRLQFRPDHELDNIQFTLHLDDYTDSERLRCFYSPEEWQEMKDGVLNLLAVLETGEIDARDASRPNHALSDRPACMQHMPSADGWP